ncbi:D-arabinitol 2-dehydrogenase [Plectosphaerella plurivora]|uniref:D-arabinitol 2-dehydrogenase n=1 Tax=Plectosphaerella plurivora TaxID=936078 RepID=A0A9P8VAA5_9PEZI|nr:D-arabinitol 2-dehydrogenase [Plectosphaerella plurivora]
MAPPAATSDIELPAAPEYPLPQSKDPLPTTAPFPSLFSLSSKTIAITGGGRGLGITFALAVLEAGGSAACLDILAEPSPVEWAHLTKIAAARNLSISYHRCDVTDEEATRTILDQVAADADARGAPFAGSIVCAGIQQKVPALEYPIADFERIQRVNVVGAFVTSKVTANILVERKRPGSIVLIASMSGQIANRGLTCTAYNTSKAAVQQMCRSLSQEWGQYGIRVNTLSPGYIRTAMTDELLAAEPEVEKTWMQGALLGRLGVPEDFKAPAVFLLSDGSSFMTGADLRVDGGHCASA